jgi:NAD(P)H-hydrate epimerase
MTNSSPANFFPANMDSALYRADQVQNLDRCAIQEHNIPGIRLMKQAGRTAFKLLLEQWPQVEHITVMCGAGNNAGDGYIVAGLAAQRRIPIDVFHVSDPTQLQGDARLAYEFACHEGVIIQPYMSGQRLGDMANTVVVDALLGTGLKGEVSDHFAKAIDAVNDSGLPVLAIDIPSGLSADTGAVLGSAIDADITITFIGMKQGLLTGKGPALCGELEFDQLNIPDQVYANEVPASHCLMLGDLLELLPYREVDAHKGSFGHVMIIGGDYGFAGAATMAGESAARMGAGLTSVATRPEHVAAVVSRCPELMVTGVTSGQSLEPLLERPSVLVIGPGLGQTPWSEQMLQQAAMTNLPMIVDADALNIISAGRLLAGQKRDNWILTPHPGEAARLLGCAITEVEADRIAAAKALQKRYGGTIILKGAGTVVVTSTQDVYISTLGNPGMASGGMGDVLSGVLGGLLAQGFDQDFTAQLAVCLHGMAADLAVEESGQRGLLATDLIPYVRQLLNAI